MAHIDPDRRRAQQRKDNKSEAGRAAAKRYREALRERAHLALGGRCAECESEDRLEIDHVNGDGASDRAKRSRKSLRHAVVRGETEGLQLLCFPCHRAKSARERRQAVA